MENCQKKFSKVVIRKILVIFVATKPRWRNGRRARFRCECREACRFESYSGHYKGEFLKGAPFFCVKNVKSFPIFACCFQFLLLYLLG